VQYWSLYFSLNLDGTILSGYSCSAAQLACGVAELPLGDVGAMRKPSLQELMRPRPSGTLCLYFKTVVNSLPLPLLQLGFFLSTFSTVFKPLKLFIALLITAARRVFTSEQFPYPYSLEKPSSTSSPFSDTVYQFACTSVTMDTLASLEFLVYCRTCNLPLSDLQFM